MQPKDTKRELTLKEKMAMQGKIPSMAKHAQTAVPDKKEPSLKTQITKAQQPPKPTKWQESREERLRSMIEEDPEQAAKLLKEIFLKGK